MLIILVTIGTLTTLEFQQEALESAGTNAEVVAAMTGAAKAIKSVHAGLSVDQVEQLMDDVKEDQAMAEEVAAAIARPVNLAFVGDEDELLAELDQLVAEDAATDATAAQVDTVTLSDLPSVPTAAPAAAAAAAVTAPVPKERVSRSREAAAAKRQEEEELAELAQWAN